MRNAILGVVLLGGLTTFSYADSTCLTGPDAWRTANVYQTNFLRGAEIVQELWEGTYGENCLDVYDLEAETIFIFGSIPQHNIVARCSQEGYHDGANEKLDEINIICNLMGSEDGYATGYFEGGVYCRSPAPDPGDVTQSDYPTEFRNACTKGFRAAVEDQCSHRQYEFHMKDQMLEACI